MWTYIAEHSSRFPSEELERIGILLLRHDTRTGTIGNNEPVPSKPQALTYMRRSAL